jgi:hypothetical protein
MDVLRDEKILSLMRHRYQTNKICDDSNISNTGLTFIHSRLNDSLDVCHDAYFLAYNMSFALTKRFKFTYNKHKKP